RQHRSPIADGRTHARAGVGRPGESARSSSTHLTSGVDAMERVFGGGWCGRSRCHPRIRGTGCAGWDLCSPLGRGCVVPVVRSVAARRGVFGVSVVLAVGLFAAACQPAKPPPPPPPPPDFQPGFQESVVFGGLSTPTVVAFSPDGRVFVGEKSGIIKVF